MTQDTEVTDERPGGWWGPRIQKPFSGNKWKRRSTFPKYVRSKPTCPSNQVIKNSVFRLTFRRLTEFKLSTRRVWEGNGTPLQSSCLENPMDGGARWASVHGVAKSWTWPSDFTFTFHFHALEKVMATHSSVLAWRIPGTGEPGGLPSMGLHRVGHDWSNLAAVAAAA